MDRTAIIAKIIHKPDTKTTKLLFSMIVALIMTNLFDKIPIQTPLTEGEKALSFIAVAICMFCLIGILSKTDR